MIESNRVLLNGSIMTRSDPMGVPQSRTIISSGKRKVNVIIAIPVITQLGVGTQLPFSKHVDVVCSYGR